ncbi:TetR/AcrR family transcriptional regulator [Tomitella biformata]|uniref:TetR/AcrR family transcriptional regulator n=1 Tax=Tomitella biformata TaxID=630403 RepID=UPI000466F3CC|nr:TetR/AcrR family transcriptional regulator [Tomitella biformata]
MSSGTARSPQPQDLPRGQRQRRERIIEAAAALLDAQPFEQIQIRDVAESAGVALGTLYRYFGSKEHLYAAVLWAWSDARPERAPAADESDPESRLRARALQSVARFEAQQNFIGLQHVIQQSADAEAQALYRDFSSLVVESFRGELVGVEEAADLITVVSAVLTFALGLYQRGGTTMAEVYRIVDRAITLVFQGPRG